MGQGSNRKTCLSLNRSQTFLFLLLTILMMILIFIVVVSIIINIIITQSGSSEAGLSQSAGAGAALSHPLLDEGVLVLHLPLLHGRVDDQLVQLHRAKQQGQDG